MTVSMTTGEMLKPDIEAPTEKCRWWSSRRHCWHERDCDHNTDNVECLHRYCCWCDAHEYTQLRVAPTYDHGPHFKAPKDESTMIWDVWGKRCYGSSYTVGLVVAIVSLILGGAGFFVAMVYALAGE